MSTVTINGEKASTEIRTEDWYCYRSAAFERLRKAPVSIEDLRALVDHVVGCTAYAIIKGSPFDDKTEATLATVARNIIAELIGNVSNEADWPGNDGLPTDGEIARDFYHVGPPRGD